MTYLQRSAYVLVSVLSYTFTNGNTNQMLSNMTLNILAALLMMACLCHTSRGQNDIMQKLVSRIEALEEKDKNKEHLQQELQHELSDTKERVHQQEELIQVLRTELQGAKHDIFGKEQRTLLLEQQVEGLLSASNVVRKKVKQRPDSNKRYCLTKEKERFRDDSVKRSSVITSKIPRNRRIRPTRTVGQPVAFHAVGINDKTHLGFHQSILFETVLTNIGNAFHVNHGTFIAPISGIYMFSVSAPSGGQAQHLSIATDLVKDGSPLARTYSKSDTGFVDQGSVTVVTELQQGNEVWVRLNHPVDTSMNGGYSSFTGVLLHEFEM